MFICVNLRVHVPNTITLPNDAHVVKQTRRMPLVGKVNPSGASKITPFFSGVRVSQSLVLCAMFYLSLHFCHFSFGHCLPFSDLLLLIAPLVL